MPLTQNGVSTTTERGVLRYEQYYDRLLHRGRVQWDYRDKTGKLHSGTATCVTAAKWQVERMSGEEITICQKVR